MFRLALLLTLTLVVLPVLAILYDAPLTPSETGMLWSSFYLMLGFAGLSFVVGELSRNYSQTDKLWGLTPIVYTWFFAANGGWDLRLVLMATLATAWGARLTFNFARRGGFNKLPWLGEEDYRWAVLRSMPPMNRKWVWSLFNLLFISFYQHALIWLFTLPILLAWGNPGPLNGIDFVAAALILTLLVVEFVADQQQYDFQTEKYRRKKAGEPLDGDFLRGFRTTGLWAWARHPNYAAEQGIWLCFYLFSIAATGRVFNWSLIGAMLLLLLFRGSSDFSEKISLGKYPSYAEYQARVGRFFPKLRQLIAAFQAR